MQEGGGTSTDFLPVQVSEFPCHQGLMKPTLSLDSMKERNQSVGHLERCAPLNHFPQTEMNIGVFCNDCLCFEKTTSHFVILISSLQNRNIHPISRSFCVVVSDLIALIFLPYLTKNLMFSPHTCPFSPASFRDAQRLSSV